MNETTELVPTQTTPMTLLERAVERGIDVVQLEKLMDLQQRWEANEARKAFAAAMAEFQAEAPIIRKRKSGDKAKYAPLEDIMRDIKPALHRCGLSVHFDAPIIREGDVALMVEATCYVTHIAGHTQTNKFYAPIDAGPLNRDGKRVMSGPQSFGSARSYAKRYALADALNLVFELEDDDAPQKPVKMATEKQLATIREYVEQDIYPDSKLAWISAHVDNMTHEEAARAIAWAKKQGASNAAG